MGTQARDDEERVMQAVATAFEDPGLEVGEVLQGVIWCFGRSGAALDFLVKEEVAHRSV